MVKDVAVIAREDHDAACVPSFAQQRLKNGDAPQTPLDRELLRSFQRVIYYVHNHTDDLSIGVANLQASRTPPNRFRSRQSRLYERELVAHWTLLAARRSA